MGVSKIKSATPCECRSCEKAGPHEPPSPLRSSKGVLSQKIKKTAQSQFTEFSERGPRLFVLPPHTCFSWRVIKRSPIERAELERKARSPDFLICLDFSCCTYCSARTAFLVLGAPLFFSFFAANITIRHLITDPRLRDSVLIRLRPA